VVAKVLDLIDENFFVVGQLCNGVFEAFDFCLLEFAIGLFRGEFFLDFEKLIVVG
jgi:hypothetical protein